MNGARASIDAGQSSIRVRVFDGSSEARELTVPGVRNDSSTVHQIAALIAEHDGFGAASIALGLSGFDGDPAAPAELLAAAPGLQRIAIAHDSVTGYLAANGDAVGAVAAVGTGVVVLGVGELRVARVDGWGALLGDAGGAYWIGRAGLDAALRAHDLRGPVTALAALAEAAFGTLDGLALAVQADGDRVARVAAFARQVTAAAESDNVAAGIVDAAAVELAHSVTTAVHAAGVVDVNARVSAVGQVLTSARLAEALARELDERMPGCRLEPPFGAPIDGVDRLHTLDAQHPLSSLVFTAAR